MKNRKFALVFALILILVLELTSRITICLAFNQHFLDINLYHFFYPELKRLNEYKYIIDKTNILVLGGSVVSEETIELKINNRKVITSFCNCNILLDSKNQFNIVTLAKPGHNSLDSYIKFQQTMNLKFDYVFVYHGINDLRANNIKRKLFDKKYRHIEFYDDINILQRHPEQKFFTLAFLIDWTIHKYLKRKKFYIPKEKFEGLLNGVPEDYVKEGIDLKTKNSFKENIESIIEIAKKKKEKVILTTFAYYIPKDYTYQKFKNKKLDYSEQIYPIELYGLPENILKGLKSHNIIIKSFQNKPNVIFFDFNTNIQKSKKNFNDVCHLTRSGCEELNKYLMQSISR